MAFQDMFDAALGQSSVSICLLIAILSLSVRWYLRRQLCKNLPPGPPALPIVGSLPFLGDRDIRKAFCKMAAKYGEIFTFYIGSERVVVLNGYRMNKEALMKHGTFFADRPNVYLFEFSKGRGVTSSNGQLWQEQRRFGLHVLRNFGLGKQNMEDCITEEGRRLVAYMKTRLNTPYHLQTLVQKSVSNVINSFAFGKMWEYDDPVFIEFINMLTEMLDSLGTDTPLFVIPQLKYIPGDPFGYNRIKYINERFHNHFRTWIKERQMSLNTDEEPNDLIGAFLVEMKKQEDKPDSTFQEFQLVRTIHDLFAAGTDTTSNTLSWTFYYLVKHPNIIDRVYAEIDDVIGSSRPPCQQDRSKMPFTGAVLSEGQRLSDLVPFNARCTTEDVALGGYEIPKGTMVLSNLNSINMDPQIWPEPEKFEPERFLNGDGTIRKIEEFAPFGMGKRVCLGESLAKMELFLFLTTILQNFELHSPDGPDGLHTEGILGMVHRPKPYDLIVKLRH